MTATQRAAAITLARVGRSGFDNHNAENLEEGDAKFIEQTKKLWQELAVHGWTKEGENGESEFQNYSDLDGKTALYLLGRAGIKHKPKYVEQGESLAGHINIDTGNQNGVVIEDDGRTAYIDHHTPDGARDTSATKLIYETMVELGMLEKDATLDKVVEFVTQMDNKTFPDEKAYYRNCYRTVLGLWKKIQPKHLYAFFKAGRSVTELLSTSDLGKYGLRYKVKGEVVDRSKEEKAKYDKSEKAYNEAKSAGMVRETRGYGKVLIDVDKKVLLGFDTARAHGCKGYVIWNPAKKSFFITVAGKDLPDGFLRQGIKVRGRMWIKETKDRGPLKVSLDDIINALDK